MAASQTQPHGRPNEDLLAVLPGLDRLVEVGFTTGTLARAYSAASSTFTPTYTDSPQ